MREPLIGPFNLTPTGQAWVVPDAVTKIVTICQGEHTKVHVHVSGAAGGSLTYIVATEARDALFSDQNTALHKNLMDVLQNPPREVTIR